MSRTNILLLEDDTDRLNRFGSAVKKLGLSYRLVSWRDANRMIAECHEFLADAALMIMQNQLPAGPWWHTDDTEMAISIVEVLRLLGSVHQDALARQFAWRYDREPDRGYGSGARKQLRMLVVSD